MTNWEALRDDELAPDILCDLVMLVLSNAEEMSRNPSNIPGACEVCQASRSCRIKHNGFRDWLAKEANVIE